MRVTIGVEHFVERSERIDRCISVYIRCGSDVDLLADRTGTLTGGLWLTLVKDAFIIIHLKIYRDKNSNISSF